MSKMSYLAIAVVLGLLLTACASFGSRNVSDIRFVYRVEYLLSGKRLEATSWITVDAGQGYYFGPGSGWSGIGCTVSGTAIPIPTNQGTIFVLLPENGFTIGARMNDVMTRLFGLPYGDSDGAWTKEWNSLKGSGRSVTLPSEYYPDFLFLPKGENLSKAREIQPEDFSAYDLSVSEVSFTAAPNVQKSTSPLIQSATDVEGLNNEELKAANRFKPLLLVVKAIS